MRTASRRMARVQAEKQELTGAKLMPRRLPALIHSLSARLLVLTIFFVMLAEILIYAPSAGRFRQTYLEQHLETGHLAILALEATPDYMVSEELEAELLRHAEAYVI